MKYVIVNIEDCDATQTGDRETALELAGGDTHVVILVKDDGTVVLLNESGDELEIGEA